MSDRPRPYTLTRTYVDRARKTNLQAEVFLRMPDQGISAKKSLQPQVFGGARKCKRFEAALRACGIFAADAFVVLARDSPRDELNFAPASASSPAQTRPPAL